MGGSTFGTIHPGEAQARNGVKWSPWKKTWTLLHKTSIGGNRIRGKINVRHCKVWYGGSMGDYEDEYQYATDKEIFEGNLKGIISDYFGVKK